MAIIPNERQAMTNSHGIGGDIRSVQLPRSPRRGVLPLPPGMPRRVHKFSTTTRRIPAAVPKKSPKVFHNPQQYWEIIQYPLFAGIALGAAASTTFGQILIIFYGFWALFWHRSMTQITFGLAILLLVAIPIFQLLRLEGIAANVAIYAYELLVIGTIGAILELKQAGTS